MLKYISFITVFLIRVGNNDEKSLDGDAFEHSDFSSLFRILLILKTLYLVLYLQYLCICKEY